MQKVLKNVYNTKTAFQSGWLDFRLSSSYTTSLLRSAPSNKITSQALLQAVSKEHHDIPSFLAYASRVGLSPDTTTYVGTHYEYTVASSLRRLGLSLTRVGGRSDLGIDLLGDWTLAAFPFPLKVIVQCKALGRGPGPSLVRELEGAFVGAPAGWRGPDVLGILTAPEAATKGVRTALGMSSLPLCFMKVRRSGMVEQCLWNAVASEKGLGGVDVSVRYSPRVKVDGVEDHNLGVNNNSMARDIILTRKGTILSTEVCADS